MRLLASALVIAVAAVALSLWADPVEASTICHGSGNWCQGYAHVATTTGGVASARCFAMRTTNAAPPCNSANGITPVNEATWQVDAGGCLVWYYFDTTGGSAPPVAPNKVTLLVSLDNTGVNSLIWQSAAAEPANGASFTFCATDTGLAGGNPRAGTYEVQVRAIKDNAAGGIGNYDVTSNGGAVVGTAPRFDQGALRARTVVSSMTRSSYPAGSTFAYGPAGTETNTCSASFTTPNVDANVEAMQTSMADHATLGVGQAGASIDVDVGSIAQDYDIDQTFPDDNSQYACFLIVTGNSALTATRWTVAAPTGHGAGISVLTDLVLELTGDLFNVDPDIRFDSDATGPVDDTDESYLATCGTGLIEAFNRNEQVCHRWGLINERGEALSRSMTFSVLDDANTVCTSHGSLTPTANIYTQTFTIPTGGGCTVTNDLTGADRHLRTTNTDQSADSATVFTVSSLLLVDAHLEADVTLTPDDHPTPDASEVLAYFVRDDGAGGDDSDTIDFWCGVQGVRGDVDVDTSGSAVTAEIRDPLNGVRASGTGDTGANGFSTASLSLLATTPLGDDWTADCDVAFNGNTGTDTEPFSINAEGGGGETIYTGADPLTVFALYDAESGLVHVSIASRFLDGTARLDAEDEIFFDVYDASHALIADDEAVLEQAEGDGAYIATWDPPADGLYEVVAHTTDPDSLAPIGAHNVVVVSQNPLDFLIEKFGPAGEPVDIDLAPNLLAVVLTALLIPAIWLTIVAKGPLGANRFLGAIVAIAVAVLAFTELETWAFGIVLAVLAGAVATVAIFLGALQFYAERPRGGSGDDDSVGVDLVM